MPVPGAERRAPSGSTRALPNALLVIAAVLLVARVGACVYETRSPAAVRERVSWVPIPSAEAEARRTRRPILYEFTAEWCGPCQAMSREVFADETAARGLEQRFVMVRVLDRQREEGRNAPDVAALQARYKVEAFPTLVIANPDGAMVDRIEGYMGRQGLLARLGQSTFKISVGRTPPPSPR